VQNYLFAGFFGVQQYLSRKLTTESTKLPWQRELNVKSSTRTTDPWRSQHAIAQKLLRQKRVPETTSNVSGVHRHAFRLADAIAVRIMFLVKSRPRMGCTISVSPCHWHVWQLFPKFKLCRELSYQFRDIASFAADPIKTNRLCRKSDAKQTLRRQDAKSWRKYAPKTEGSGRPEHPLPLTVANLNLNGVFTWLFNNNLQI